MKKNILLLKGGGSEEHNISLLSSQYLRSCINESEYNIIEVEIDHEFKWHINDGQDTCHLNFDRELVCNDLKTNIDLVIPCIHGYPGETGHLQAYLEMIKLPYLGASLEKSTICFNKILTKMWLENAGIPTTAFITLSSPKDKIKEREEFFRKHQSVFVKASNQGSSVGCYPVHSLDELDNSIIKAFKYSSFVILEKLIKPRELEISVFEYNNEVHATVPCEIISPNKFYSYEEKYSDQSKTQIILEADIEPRQRNTIREMAKKAFKEIGIQQFCRMDFFIEDHIILLNEINTFPGMTPISMFPKMIENYGINFKDFISYQLKILTQ